MLSDAFSKMLENWLQILKYLSYFSGFPQNDERSKLSVKYIIALYETSPDAAPAEQKRHKLQKNIPSPMCTGPF